MSLVANSVFILDLYSFQGSMSLVAKSVFILNLRRGSGGHFEGVAK